MQHRCVKAAIDALGIPRPAPIAHDQIRMQRQHVFQRCTHLAQSDRAGAVVGIIPQRPARERSDLPAIRQREHILVSAIIERHDA